jgi:hypothetical protein
MDDLHAAVYDLVKRFVERQRLPYEVIKKYRPHLVGIIRPRPSKEYLIATFKGYWGDNNEWKYRLHGGGCHLTHTITEEVIGWDSPDLRRFDPYWFTDWLSWILKQDTDFPCPSVVLATVSEQGDDFRKRVFEILAKLHQLGKLGDYPDRTNRYELLIEVK